MRSGNATGEAARILVVDDDALVLGALCATLRSADYQVVAAESGEAALTFARELAFDVALCDRMMPGIDGIEVFETLRQMQPMCARVLLTGGLDLPTTVNAVNRGAVTSVLEKPTPNATLLHVVAQALHAQRQIVKAYREMERSELHAEREVIRDILRSDEIGLAVQPIVQAADDKLYGLEGLLRTLHPDFPTPLSLIAAAERYRLVHELADVVADHTLKCLHRIRRDVKFFMNVHPAELGDPDALRDRLTRLQPHADRVVLEITERSTIYGIAAWERSVEVIRGLGFDIAVDDLGAGYSALAILAELQPSFIKVDMSIVRDSDVRPHKRRLLDLLCRFADATSALLVAEGIETEGEAEVVRACGASLLQGYLFGRPRLPTNLQVVRTDADQKSDEQTGKKAG